MLLSEWLSGERGRGAALAKHLKIPPSMVARMGAGKKPVPIERSPFIQEFTKNEVTCEELCPEAREFFVLVRKLGCACSRDNAAGGEGQDRRTDHAAARAYENTLADRRAGNGSAQ